MDDANEDFAEPFVADCPLAWLDDVPFRELVKAAFFRDEVASSPFDVSRRPFALVGD